MYSKMSRRCLCMGAMSILAACHPSAELAPQVSEKIIEDAALPPLSKSQNYHRESVLSQLAEYAQLEKSDPQKGYSAQLISMIGREDILVKDGIFRHFSNSCDPIALSPDTDIHERLTTQIADQSLVIINESHSNPLHRQFILELVKFLKSQGFEYYAAETFGDGLTFGDPKIASDSDGFYSSEPIFGRLITYVKSSGFKLIKYEQTQEQSAPENAPSIERIKFREEAQSDNLIAAVLGENPDAKIIIHVGYSHVAETPIRDIKWMAALLKEKTGLDPVTISQTHCRALGEKTVLTTQRRDEDGKLNPAYTDYLIGHPQLTFTNNRPDWRRATGDRDVSIPDELKRFDKNVLIQARQIDHADEATPIDIVALRPGETDIPLLLPIGTYRVEAFDETGRIGSAYRVTVN